MIAFAKDSSADIDVERRSRWKSAIKFISLSLIVGPPVCFVTFFVFASLHPGYSRQFSLLSLLADTQAPVSSKTFLFTFFILYSLIFGFFPTLICSSAVALTSWKLGKTNVIHPVLISLVAGTVIWALLAGDWLVLIDFQTWLLISVSCVVAGLASWRIGRRFLIQVAR